MLHAFHIHRTASLSEAGRGQERRGRWLAKGRSALSLTALPQIRLREYQALGMSRETGPR